MRRIKFQLFLKRNGQYENQCIGPAETILETVRKPQFKNSMFTLYAVKEDGQLVECVTSSSAIVAKYVK